MTSYYLSINRGKTESVGNVTAGTSLPSADFIFITDATTHSPTRLDQIKALEAIMHYIKSGGNVATGTDLPAI